MQLKINKENTLTGEVIWAGKSGLCTTTDYPITETISDEKYTYVIMKVRVDKN